MDYKKAFYICLCAAIILFLILIGGSVGYERTIDGIKNQLADAQAENRKLGIELADGLDRIAELEQSDRETRKTVERIGEYNSRATELIRESISETASIDELIDAIESAIDEITKAKYLADNLD